MTLEAFRANIGSSAHSRDVTGIMNALETLDLEPLFEPEEWDPRSPFITIIDASLSSKRSFPTPDLTIALNSGPAKTTDPAGLVRWVHGTKACVDQVKLWAREWAKSQRSIQQMLGKSDAFRSLHDSIHRVAPFDAGVLVYGETGTGKELTAREIHYASHRQSGPFVPVNSGAYSDELFASEMFGFEKGAFTDAKRARPGLVEHAAGGTLFLDEIDSLSVKTQVILLRFLQDNEYRVLGGSATKRADVRIIAGTNRVLEERVEKGLFREDLFYRLDVLRIDVPPLRARVPDVQLLSQHFLNKFSMTYEKPMKWLTPETLAWMARYDWPGNIRELENYLHKAFVHAPGSVIHAPAEKQLPVDEHVVAVRETDQMELTESEKPPKAVVPGCFQTEKSKAIREFEVEYLNRVLRLTKGNISRAARVSGQDRRNLRRLIDKHGISRNNLV